MATVTFGGVLLPLRWRGLGIVGFCFRCDAIEFSWSRNDQFTFTIEDNKGGLFEFVAVTLQKLGFALILIG